MRIDKFINTVNIVKKRSIAQDMCETGVIFINGVAAKSSRNVKVGDIIQVKYLENTKRYKVLQIPTLKSIPKTKSQEYAVEF
ncbi:RNA-binding S4 domain-containing protein [Helicobacter cappadocius]|uniref:RQC P-site tRNA stabilizing factor n=1 Tax=Helicobacter cappadocius TaxID=3063998 RepID=A0AA90T8X8_9HELI|nr:MULTISPECIES: RNA-binding S4 domain-containing protein [unclassified Helicobacter]MDO7252400.1 RNA-binding S4 domain-containing protein [Helicobacter sp. faydin-H75]MDP2538267.1 RNA-binding S4 domain-containing protein [Helicobacter sp. faydin-H76]